MPIDPRIYMQHANQMPRGEKTGMLNQFTGNYDQMRQRQIQMDEQARRDRIQQEQMKMNALRAKAFERQELEAQRVDQERNALNAYTNDMMSMYGQEMPGTVGPMQGGGMPLDSRASAIQQAGRDGVGGDGMGVVDKLYPQAKEASQGTMTDIWRYAGLAEAKWNEQNPGVPMPPEVKMQAMMDIKRAMPTEAGAVKTAQLQAEQDIKPATAGMVTTAQLESELRGAPQVEAAKQASKDTETRDSALIERGITAAESSATIRRGIELMKTVETGGYDAAALAAKRLFGVEGADEGELSQAMGKAVLSQLRETFGAAFTQEEGNRLIRLEAGFGKSVANNRRLLSQSLKVVERTARRAMAAAKRRGDTATVKDIEELLKFSLSTDEAVKQEPQRIQFDAQGNIIQ